MKYFVLVGSAFASLVALGCGSTPEGTGGSGGTGGAASSSSSTSSSSGATTSSSSSTSSSSTSTSSSSTTSSSGSTSSSSSSGGGGVADPNLDGPYTYAEVDDTIASVPGGDTNLPVHCAHPTAGPTTGPYPVVVIGHGMQLPASQYYSYAKRLASFGYVALTVDFTASLFGVDNVKGAKDLLAGLDWAQTKVGLNADPSNAGMTGHSLGGKTALLAATLDPRVKAAITLDPVDGGGPTGCSAPACVDVSTLMPGLHIPTGFVGETTDAAAGFMPCAPAADNFQTFYAGTNSPSLSVTVAGANHMSFLDDVASCGLTCAFCQPATASNAQVNGLARAFVTAFYERHLRGDAGYDTYLTGAQAQARYVTTGQAVITSK
jgi:dienelactone hydrolase